MLSFATIMLLAGIGIPIMAAMTSSLGKHLSSPVAASTIAFFIAFYVLSISFVATHFGVGNAIFFVLLGQLLSAAIIDHYGLFGAQINHLSIMRISGILVMVFGVWLTQNA